MNITLSCDVATLVSKPPEPGLYESQATYLSVFGASSSPIPVPFNYAIITLPRQTAVPPKGRMIGSRLDAKDMPCRVAFTADVLWGGGGGEGYKFYRRKEKACRVHRVGPKRFRVKDGKETPFDCVAEGLFGQGAQMSNFKGLKLTTLGGDIGVISDSFGTEGKFRVDFPAGVEALGVGAEMKCEFWKVKGGEDMEQCFLSVPDRVERRDIIVEIVEPEKPKAKTGDARRAAKKEVKAKAGMVFKVKDEYLVVEGMFTPDIDVDKFKGRRVVVGDGREGEILGRFGKAGKCKVKAEGKEGDKVNLVDD